ncbi:hypothetical protein ACJRO7_013633 [Eucalyptus globulus]|uniref:TIR domain-containing protein n=1 Tax=Eucalyptus globulus TaxID=34317 RepID=A0ABD3KYK4_EUCGL
MEDGKRKPYAEASSSTISMGQRPSDERESGSPLPDSPEKINAGPSASYASVIGNNYCVFLSFRGPDTRKGFVDHLYHELVRVGLHRPNFVFRDDENLDLGEPIEMILSAIKCSKVSIPVISKTYAASQWCLREIIQIMECVKSGQQKVYPVLYKVTPGDVRDMKGKFGKAFRDHNSEFDEEIKRKGPVALRELVNSKVIESEKEYSGHEGKLVKELVKKIMSNYQHDFLPSLPQDLVGIDEHVASVMNLADSGTMKSANTASSEAQVIVIYGIGGIGKTTLATVIYKKLSNQFEYRSFLNDIRETIKSKGMKHVQSLHISNLTKKSGHSEHDSGIEMIRFICEKKKVLVLLDDVDRRDHLDNLIGGCNFESGSWVIITCRDKALLKSKYKEYKLEEMNPKDSLNLFSRYAFKRGQPLIELVALSNDIVATIGGLPLALVIIGSFLEGKYQRTWTETLEKLRKVPHMDVQQKLMISYDSLEYEEQQMFLDIACFFIGINKTFATYLWEDLQYYVDSGLERMIELSLMKIDHNNELRMHDQLRDLGRAIACPTNKKAWKCSRLWDEKAIIVQRSKEENRYIEALHLDKNGSIKFMERESFRRMPYLKFLHLSEVVFVGDFGDSLSELRWLEWEMCPGSFNATSIYLEKLQVLDLSGGFISENWEGWNSIKMEMLKVLNLSQCSKLKSTPKLSALKNLERLILEDCAYLEKIDPSIGDVTCLVSLNLRCCKVLNKLPEQLGKLKNLEELVIDETMVLEIPPCIGSLKKLKMLTAKWCFPYPKLFSSSRSNSSSLEECFWQPIPSSIGELGELVLLDLSGTGIEELLESIEKLNKLKILRIRRSDIKRLPSSIGKLQSLQELLASRCKLEGQILFDKGGLSSLKTLDLSYTKISGLPENLDQLSSLKHLDLVKCRKLESLPKPPCRLSSLRLTCRSNELQSLSHLKHLQELSLDYCESLQSIPSLSHLESLQKLYLRDCKSLQSIPSLSHLEHLRELNLHDCWSLQSISSLSHLKHLQELVLWECRSLQSIPELPSRIRKLLVLRCTELERLPNLSNLEFLSELRLEYCYGLKQLDGMKSLKSLRVLCLPLHTFREGDHLHAIEGLEQLGSLEVVDISWRNHIRVLDLSKSEHLKRLIVKNCKSLVEIRCPSKFLEYFDRDGCESLKKLPHDKP